MFSPHNANSRMKAEKTREKVENAFSLEIYLNAEFECTDGSSSDKAHAILILD